MAGSGKDARGKFAKGNTFANGNHNSRGRPPVPVEEAYFKAFKTAIGLKDWELATKAILKKAMNGDVYAYRTLAAYAMRLPAARSEVLVKGDFGVEIGALLDRVYGEVPKSDPSNKDSAGSS